MLLRVYEVVKEAPSTSEDVADALGITIRIASAHLSALAEDGLIVLIGKLENKGKGPARHIYGVPT